MIIKINAKNEVRKKTFQNIRQSVSNKNYLAIKSVLWDMKIFIPLKKYSFKRLNQNNSSLNIFDIKNKR